MIDKDPFKKPTYSLNNRVIRSCWILIWLILFKPSPKLFYAWRNLLLKIFGAKLGPGCAVNSNVKIWAPWNLTCEDCVAIAEGVEIYNPKMVLLKSHAIISQGAYLCGASHDINSADFETISSTISVGAYGWVCARATVMPGVVVGDGAVLALGSVATKNIPDWSVYGGIPARHIGYRKIDQ